MPSFNIPEITSDQDFVCPVGYTKTENACVRLANSPNPFSVIRKKFYSGYGFEYYENAGILVGRYKIDSSNIQFNNIPSNPDVTNFNQTLQATNYFGQNVKSSYLSNFTLGAPKQNLKSGESVLFLQVKHSRIGSTSVVEILHPDIPTEDTNPLVNNFIFGEFHLITNTLKSFVRANINFELLQDFKQESAFIYKTVDFDPVPSLSDTDGEASFVEMYLGYTRVPLQDRPPSLERSDYPSLADPINGTQWLKWKSINESCSGYRRIYNGTVSGEYFEEIDSADGHYICQTKCSINKSKLLAYLNRSFDSNSYPLNTESSNKEMIYQILIYPPSYYFYPAKNPASYINPIPNYVNRELVEVKFETPKNYKADGNIQYRISFFSDNGGTLLFSSSSSKQDSDYEDLFWEEISPNQQTSKVLTPNYPTFDNQFNELNGVPATSQDSYIRYRLSPPALASIKDRETVYFKIYQFDGTRYPVDITTSINLITEDESFLITQNDNNLEIN